MDVPQHKHAVERPGGAYWRGSEPTAADGCPQRRAIAGHCGRQTRHREGNTMMSSGLPDRELASLWRRQFECYDESRPRLPRG